MELKEKKSLCAAMIENALNDLDSGRSLFGKVRCISGRGQFQNLFWWGIPLSDDSLKDKYRKSGYHYLYLTPYIVTQEHVDELFDFTGEYILKNEDTDERYWGKRKAHLLPHLDSSTGNLHVEFDPIKWDGSIKQILLVRNVPQAHYGTKIDDTNDFCLDELLVYKFRDKKVMVPKECYYPRIDQAGRLQGESLDKLLKTVMDIFFMKSC